MDWICRLFLVVACLLQTASAAGVLGIDLGSEFLKMAIVKHGASSAVDIVLNEQTQRKTITYLGFRGDERYFGEDAFQLHTRFPTSMVTYLTHWAGQTYDEAQSKQEQLMFRFQFIESLRGTVNVSVTPDTAHSAEELLAMLLTHVKELASTHAEMPIDDCVIAIPASYNTRQRQALSAAAEIAGLHVFSFMHDTVAAALQYGISRRGFSEDINLMVFDMGAAKLEVGIFTLRPPVNGSKDILGHMQVRSIQWDDVGGRHFDALIARQIAAEFHVKSGKNVLAMKTVEGAKATAKLMRTAKKVKETLSANKDAPAPVEGIYEERDFNTVISREQFDLMASPLAAKAMDTVKRALADAGLSIEQIDVCELMGGGTRVPIVQDQLSEFVKKPLSKTLNTDEAIAMATAFQAAKESGLFRVKTFLIEEPRALNVTFALSPDENVPKPARRPLFLAGDNSTGKTVTMFRSKSDFSITIFNERMDGTVEPIDEFQLVNVSEAFKRMGLFGENVHKNSTHRLEVRFFWSDMGFVTCGGATAKFDEVLNTTKKVKRKTTKADDGTSASSNASDVGDDEDDDVSPEPSASKFQPAAAEDQPSTEKVTDPSDDAETAEKEGSTESTAASGADNATSANETNSTSPPEELYEIVNTTTTKRHHEKVPVVIRPLVLPLPPTKEEVQAAKDTLRKLKERDEAKRRKAQARNDLETEIYNTRYDKFFDIEELKPFYNQEEEEAIRKLLNEIEEWLEDDGSDASVEGYSSKLAEIRKLTGAVLSKKADEEAKKTPSKDADKKKKTTKKKAKKASAKDEDSDDDDDDDDEKDKSKTTRDEL